MKTQIKVLYIWKGGTPLLRLQQVNLIKSYEKEVYSMELFKAAENTSASIPSTSET